MSRIQAERHPLSELFSKFDLGEDKLRALADDIKSNGLQIPITSHDGMILDGWNRYQACLLADIEPSFKALDPKMDPWKFVWALNGNRRHMTAVDLVTVYLAGEELSRRGGGRFRPPASTPSGRIPGLAVAQQF